MGNNFEMGFDPHGNCPSNDKMREAGKPAWEQTLNFSTRDMEENKTLVEKQNFTISTGIAGGKVAENEVWINPFTESFKRATFTGTTNSAVTLGGGETEMDRMRKSHLPFGMNSPVEKETNKFA